MERDHPQELTATEQLRAIMQQRAAELGAKMDAASAIGEAMVSQAQAAETQGIAQVVERTNADVARIIAAGAQEVSQIWQRHQAQNR